VVAVFPKMQSDAALADYCRRIANAWKVGQKDKNNGLVLFVFIQDRKMQIETGTGYEKIVTDAICQKILDEEITPHFRKGDFDGGLTAAVNAMIAATRGEYKGADATPPAASPQEGGK
ncbi:MAG TPA: TPM domain-containing protein, partial [Chthoniobacteraceae bacterium]|nr:TPM domain-containing protein [Chthoniobacteraceae bacterium]